MRAGLVLSLFFWALFFALVNAAHAGDVVAMPAVSVERDGHQVDPRRDAGVEPVGDRVGLVMVVREVLPDGGVSPLPDWVFEPKPPRGLWR
jgi:hypothetical protein